MIPFFDCHYDLLTSISMNMDSMNKNNNIDILIDTLEKLYDNNVKGSIINLFFMSKEEMKNELDIKNIDVKEMFKKSVEQLEFLKMSGYIKDDVKFIYSIEGCDFLEVNDLEELYKLGLRSILPVWNNQNRYASGIKTTNGLTEEGKKLIKKASELGIIIDVSHMNEKSFFESLEYLLVLKKEGYDPIIVASHSNLKTFKDVGRNLSDKQINTLKYLDAYMGLFTSSKFISDNYLNITKQERQKDFLNMLNYLINDLKYPTNRILISTDDMEYYPDKNYHGYNCFDLDGLNKEIYKLLESKYSDNIIEQIMFNNGYDIYNKVNQKEKRK